MKNQILNQWSLFFILKVKGSFRIEGKTKLPKVSLSTVIACFVSQLDEIGACVCRSPNTRSMNIGKKINTKNIFMDR